MYYPSNFDRQRAIELGNLVKQAYEQYEAFKEGKPWVLKDGYDLVCEVLYSRSRLELEADGEGDASTPIDVEIRISEGNETFRQGLGDRSWPMGFVAKRGDDAYLVFRGTMTVSEWVCDMQAGFSPYPHWTNGGEVHKGFLKSYDRCRDSFFEHLGGIASCNFYITGHSLGAALSTLSLPDIVTNAAFSHSLSLYNFGSPRTGDSDFADAYNKISSQTTFRVVNTEDLATTVPPTPVPQIGGLVYTHVDLQVAFTTQKKTLGGNHDMDTYLDALK